MKMIDVEISKNIAGGITLCVCNKNGGERIQGGKIGGCETIKTFTVEAEYLINAIRNYAYTPEGEAQ